MAVALALLLACGGQPAQRPAASPPPATRGEPVALCINEVMPANRAAAFDENGHAGDWIELHNPGDVAVDLAGWSITDDRADPDRHVFGRRSIEPGGFLLLWADDLAGVGDTHLPFSLKANGEEVALFDPEGDASVVAYGAVHDDFSLARRTDCCTGEGCWTHVFRGTPGGSNAPEASAIDEVLPLGSTWSYLDTGDPPAAGWKRAGFEASGWGSGPGPLGYGDGHIVTAISYGGDPEDKVVTTWFRTAVGLSDLDDVTAAEIGLLRDDGAVVYVNGEEVIRSNLPEGSLSPDTLAQEAVGGSSETAVWPFELDPALLVEGDNVIAVEVHQAAPTSSDLGFDLSLTVSRGGASAPGAAPAR